MNTLPKDKVLLLFHPFSTKGMEELLETCHVDFLPIDKNFEPKVLDGLPKDVSVLATDFTLPITKEVIDYFPSLRLISNYAVGFNNIDVDYATSKGILVTNTPNAVIQSTAELTVALLLSVSRRVAEWDRVMRQNRSSDKGGIHSGMGVDLCKKTAGIIGYGNIGKAVGKILKAFGVRLLYNKRNRLSKIEEMADEATYATLDEIYQQSDIILLHTPYAPETHHLIDEKALKQMKSNAILINVARGSVVNEVALVKALKEKWIAGAGLDVFENNDTPQSDLYDMHNVTLTPHVGTQTIEAREDMMKEMCNNILGFIKKDRAISCVNKLE